MNEKYDWATAALTLELCNSNELSDLVAAAKLDPIAGDLSDFDLSGIDLRNQDMRRWDLRHANFSNARIANANLTGAIINPDSIIEAADWHQAKMDEVDRYNSLYAEVRRFPVSLLELSKSTADLLFVIDADTIGDIMLIGERQLVRRASGGQKHIRELEEVLRPFRIELDYVGTSPENTNSDKFHLRRWAHVRVSNDDGLIEEVLTHMEYLRSPPLQHM